MIKHLKVTVEGKTYEVTVETAEDSALPQPASEPSGSATVTVPEQSTSKPAAAAGAGVVVSPLAGKLVAYSVSVGQQVAAGQELAVVEAMKMNTYINCTAAGKIVVLLAMPGDGVEEGQGLLKIE